MPKIPHSRPCFDDADLKVLDQTLRRRFLSSGRNALAFGRQVATLVKKKWGIPTQSGTDALATALRLLALPPQTAVLTPAYICSAPLDALAMNGLTAKPVDIDRSTLAIDVALVNRERGVKTVIAAHLFGIPAPFQEIRNKVLIEDCAQTLKVGEHSHPVGSSGCFTVCSFYATKLFTTGHGGLLAGNDRKQWDQAQTLFNHDQQEEWRPHWHFLMSDLNAALGLSQLKKLDRFIAERRTIAARYLDALAMDFPFSGPGCYSRFPVIVGEGGVRELCARFERAGIEAKRPVYKPLYQYLGLDGNQFPNAQWAHNHIISVPLYPGMPETAIVRIEKFLKEHKHALCRRPSA